MRHQNGLRKLGRTSEHRRALLRNMSTSLVLAGQCETTVQKAKELKRVTDKLITLAKRDSLHARRQAYSYLMNKDAVHKLFAELGPKYKTRNGGYTRVLRTSQRPGDAAEMAIIQLVEDGAPAGAA